MLTFWNKIRKSGQSNDSGAKRACLLLEKIAESLPRLEKRLSAPLSEFGENLTPLSEHSDVLIADSEKLLSLATGQHGGPAVLKETSNLLEEPLQFLNTWRTDMSSHEEALDVCARLLLNMLQAEQKLQATISPLKHVQTMFKIEAAPLAEETRLIFAGLTEKIESVHKRVQDTFIRQFQIVAESNREVREVLESVRSENGRLHRMIQHHQTELRESLNKLDGEIAENLNRDVQLRDVSKVIAGEVYAMVVALQSQDIVTQQLEHVAKAISEMRAAGTAPTSYALRLQAAHVRQVQERIETTRAELVRAVETIVTSVGHIDEKCLHLSELDGGTAAAHGTIQVLLETIPNARALTRSAMELALQSGERIRPIAHTASSLIGALEVLAFEMHLIALNAQIQAVQIGRGTGLEVLAAHTANVSRTTEELVQSVASDVERLASGLGKIQAAFDRLGEEGRIHVETLDTAGSEQEAKLHSLRDETLAKMRSVGETSEWIRSAAEDLRAHLQQLSGVIPEMGRFDSELCEAAELCASSTTAADLASLSESVAQYTMHSERKIHDEIAGTALAAEQNDSATVELF